MAADDGDGAAPPGELFSALVPVSAAADAYLQQAAAQLPRLSYLTLKCDPYFPLEDGLSQATFPILHCWGEDPGSRG